MLHVSSTPASTPIGDVAACDRAPLPPRAAVVVFAFGAALAATALPLFTYTMALALFGLAHVLAELRYVDERFGPRVARVVRWQMGALLACVVAGRAAVVAGVLTARVWRPAELLLVAALALTALPRLRAAGARAASVALAVVASLAAGAIWAPEATLLVLAVGHNVTPAGFLAERLRGAERRRALVTCAALLGVAALIATGAPAAWLGRYEWWRPEWTLLPAAGGLSAHLGQFVPQGWRSGGLAISIFSAAVFLQCLHYGAVLHVLPRLGGDPPGANTAVRWPRRRKFAAIVACAGLLLFGGFLVSFADARALYSLAAAVHAWIEIPLLLLALAPVRDRRPERADAREFSTRT